ncbi:hypothetical protein QBC37DRAFT_415457 [Rhypophila decipiens]|uniref:NWD NACHT-NTPase N-terminal domain-containing protein n=1 Tax=Rhypophila decipiens TaxID=261697 RepID=A0AAN6YDJ7_9PEZI|nr:hypothetical protein QBC37DRAFT_415457 [Rhypophila decipiens]
MGARSKIRDLLKGKGRKGQGSGSSSLSAPVPGDQGGGGSSLSVPVPGDVEGGGSSSVQSVEAPPSPTTAEASVFSATTVSSAGGTDTTDPWARAYKEVEERERELMADYRKHLVSLLPSEAAASSDLSSLPIELIVQTLLEDRNKKQWRVSLLGKDVLVREQVERLVKFFLWSDGFVKQAVSAQPYAALAWSGVSLLLPLLTSGTTQNTAMLEGFNAIGDFQVYWQICEKKHLGPPPHQLDHHQLIASLVRLYSYMIEYQARVVCHLSKAQLSRAWHDATSSNDWAGMITKIETLDKRCRDLIPLLVVGEVEKETVGELRSMQETRWILDEIRRIAEASGRQTREIYEDQKQSSLLQDLASAFGDRSSSNDKCLAPGNRGSGVEDYKNFNPPRVPQTCEWFFNDDRFRKWRCSGASSLLWVSAGPGCGKSVLSRALIDDKLLSNDATTSNICYFFFKDGDDRRMDITNALCAILHQLFLQDNSKRLIQIALDRHKIHGKSLFESFSELWGILESCAKSPDAGEIVCLLDALDECNKDGRDTFLRRLKSFYDQAADRIPESPPSKLKFLITSRPYDDLVASFGTFSGTAEYYMRFDGDDMSDDINNDINRVIDAKIPEIAGSFTEKDQRAIARRLKGTEHRTYLWLYLVLDIIVQNRAEYSRRPDMEALLSDLPSEVSRAYEKILSRSRNQLKTATLLKIVLAAVRPLSLEETNIALALALAKQSITSEEALGSELWPTDSFRTTVTNLCGLFISVYDSKLYLIHQTAREFLLHNEPQGRWQGRFNSPQSHRVLSRSCVRFLLLLDVNGAAFKADYEAATEAAYKSDFLTGEYRAKYARVLPYGRPFLSYSALYWRLHFRSHDTGTSEEDLKDARELCRVSTQRPKLFGLFLFHEEWKFWVRLELYELPWSTQCCGLHNNK